MGKTTAIEWCDSTLNLMMGCGGCELSAAGGSGTCYAETLTNRHAGHSSGYPSNFYSPKLFPERLREAERWPDLTGVERPEKPHLSGLPRHIFHGDMGDYWTESLPQDWLGAYVDRIAAIPGVHIFLTKRPRRMAKFWEAYGTVPHNFILMTSVTDAATLKARAGWLMEIEGATLGLSIEPLIEAVDPTRIEVVAPKPPYGPGAWLDCLRGHMIGPDDMLPTRIRWVVVGGESGHGARPMHPMWVRSLRDQCVAAGVSFFFKQWGAWQPYVDEHRFTHGGAETDANAHRWLTKDGDGGLVWLADDDGGFQNWTGDLPESLDDVAILSRVGKHAAGRLLDGREWSEMPSPTPSRDCHPGELREVRNA